jgi:hypothetical protein
MASRFSNVIALLALLTFIGNAAARNIFRKSELNQPAQPNFPTILQLTLSLQ